MAHIDHAPIQDALNRVRQLSADEEARRLAFVRERAQRDELSLLKEAREERAPRRRADRVTERPPGSGSRNGSPSDRSRSAE
ncbi:MAG: hypothetical protein MZV65_07210 [Chromatiales bacterium]|nr:hypothetical protein [Chromatiales bacterium]